MEHEAVEIMRCVVERGGSRLKLVRAALAAARAVLPLIVQSQAEAVSAIGAIERWVRDPSDENTVLAENQIFSAEFFRGGTCAPPEIFARLAVGNALLSCFRNSNAFHSAIFCVESAVKAADGLGIDIAVLVTAELL